MPCESGESLSGGPSSRGVHPEGPPTADGLLALGAALCERRTACHFSLSCPPVGPLIRETTDEGSPEGAQDLLGRTQRQSRPISWLKRAFRVAVYRRKVRGTFAAGNAGSLGELSLPEAAVGGPSRSNSSSTPQPGGPSAAKARSEAAMREAVGGPDSPGALSDTLFMGGQKAQPVHFAPVTLTASSREGTDVKKGPLEAHKEGYSSEEDQGEAPSQPAAAAVAPAGGMLGKEETRRGPCGAPLYGETYCGGFAQGELGGPRARGPYACCWLQQQQQHRHWDAPSLQSDPQGGPSLEEQKAFFAASRWGPMDFTFIRTVGRPGAPHFILGGHWWV